jgi:hypothetical protein
MIDYNNIYAATKKIGPSKKHSSRSLSNGSTNTPKCNVVVIARGEMLLVSMVSRGCVLQLVHTLFSHDLAFQHKVLERML